MTETQVSEFEQLMSEVAAGSEDAVWKLAETYTPYILRAVRPRLTPQVRRRVDSQDLAQILWASILLRRGDLIKLKTPQQLIAYLGKAAKNRAIDARRQFLRTEKYDMDREESLERLDCDDGGQPRAFSHKAHALHTRELSPSQFASVRERWNEVIAQTSDRDRCVLQLRLQGESFEAISARLRINELTAIRAIQRLIAQFSK